MFVISSILLASNIAIILFVVIRKVAHNVRVSSSGFSADKLWLLTVMVLVFVAYFPLLLLSNEAAFVVNGRKKFH